MDKAFYRNSTLSGNQLTITRDMQGHCNQPSPAISGHHMPQSGASSSLGFDTLVITLACACVALLFQRYAPEAYMVSLAEHAPAACCWARQ